MKCKKYDQAWFDNKYVQILNTVCIPEKKLQRLNNFMKLAKAHDIVPKITKESKKKFVREDFGISKTRRGIRARKARLKRKHN